MELGICHERDDLGGGRFRHTQHLRPIAYHDGIMRRIASDWQQGDASFPHAVSTAPMLAYVAADGMRRICPTRDPARYIEIGAPYVKSGAAWQKVAFGSATRSGNRITWSRSQSDLSIVHGGHFLKLDIALKNGYVPPNGQFAFPVGLTGLTRTGGQILADGVPVMQLRPPVVYDGANTSDTRPIAWDFAAVSGQSYLVFTLPGLTGMTSPVVDPTLTKQPDATEGIDTYFQENLPDSAAGSATNINVRGLAGNRANGLLKFDLSSLAGATINSATLYLYAIGGSSGGGISVNRILSANSGWVKGATWNYASPSSLRWAGDAASNGGTDAGCSVSGTDYSATLSGSVTWASAAGTENAVTLNATEFGSMVTVNAGLLLRATTTYALTMQPGASDHTTAAYRPKLVVDYTLAATFKPWFVQHSRIIGGGAL